ncbi:ABC transporter substrate-binding protein [Desulfosporosinus metallidurans]|uniref:ABC transporter substrate-binding protein n=1 Tax=Desulfosporosinus metallidurans TaxID=1888891 RepID=A0A1Q8QQB7_9FIRM|nr:ABC transporter substrate-binding protein [Desulfosporosinus metallidurans]
MVLSLLGMIVFAGCSPLSPPSRVTNVAVLAADQTRIVKFEGLKQGLSELGYGKDRMHFQILNASGDSKKLVMDAQELVRQAPDLLVATGVAEAEAFLLSLTPKSRIPVIMIGVTAASELVDRFQAKGISVTGVDNGHVELTGKRLELLQLLFPDRSKFIVVYDPNIKASLQALEKIRDVLGSEHIRYEAVPVSEDIGLSKLQEHSFQKNEAIFLLPSYFIENRYREIRDLELKYRTPVMGFYDTEVSAGYTAAYGLSYFDQGYQGARIAIRMLKEKKSIPFDMPDSVELRINRQAIEKIGEKVAPVAQSFAEPVDTIGN